MIDFSYKPDGDVLKEFLKDDHFFRGIRGPVGSGKSVACCVEIFRRSLAQEPDKKGKRRTRWAVVRNTNPQLKTTTIKTWLEWFPEDEWGSFNWSPPYTHHIKRGDLDMEVIFLALDRPEDVKKLLSLEVTGIWVNEAREVPKAIIDGATLRVGRYPSRKDGGNGATWKGIFCDTNAPEEDHWWPIMAGDVPVPDHISAADARNLVKPNDWRFFNQPPGMLEVKDKEGEVTGYELNPGRENGKYTDLDYYEKGIQGKTVSYINVYVLNRLGSAEDGKPVYPMFTPSVHKAKEEIPILPGHPVYLGIDFGLTPACVFAQKIRGRWLFQRELVSYDMGVSKFSGLIREVLTTKYPDCPYTLTGDPAGDYRAQTDEDTPFKVLRAAGFKARPASTNDPALRIETVETVLNSLVDGQPGFLVDPFNCAMLTKGFETGYHYRRLQVSGERYDDKPNKNIYSHVHDAAQYLLLGAGEGKALVRSAQQTQSAFNARGDYDIFKRRERVQPRRFNPFERSR